MTASVPHRIRQHTERATTTKHRSLLLIAILVALAVLVTAGTSSAGYRYCTWTGDGYDLSTGTADDQANGSNCAWWLADSYTEAGATRFGVGAVQSWPQGTGAGVTVALLDTGVDLQNTDYGPNLLPGRNTYDRNGDVSDHNGHGAALASVIAAAANNGGYVGVAPNAKIRPVRVLGGLGGDQFDAGATVRGIYWAIAHHARVLNLSLGTSNPIPGMTEALKAAQKANVVVVIAAGNQGLNLDKRANRVYPDGSGFPNVITVGNTTPLNTYAFDSNWGPRHVQIAAPGSNLFGDYVDGGYGWIGGTSAATAVVSGAAAVVMSAHPDATATQVVQALIKGSQTLPALAGKTQGGLLSIPGALAVLGSGV